MKLRNEVRNALDAVPLTIARLGRNAWLGRQDSNLRMPVPKTGGKWPFWRGSKRNGPLVHRPLSIAYARNAEQFGPNTSASGVVG